MFSHVTLGISDLDRALSFYRPVMTALGWEQKFIERDPPGPWAGWTLPGSDGWPQFVVTLPFDRDTPAAPGNGPMVAFRVATRDKVDEVHTLALSLGAEDAGAPCLRPRYHADYYGSYFRDLDSNKLCVVCHAPQEAA